MPPSLSPPQKGRFVPPTANPAAPPATNPGPRSTDVVYLSLRGTRFCVSSEILGLFPDSVLMSLFPAGLIAFFPAPPHQLTLTHRFHCCSGGEKGGEWLEGVEGFKWVEVDFDEGLFWYLVEAFRDLVLGNLKVREGEEGEGGEAIPSVAATTAMEAPTAGIVETVVVLREEMEFFVISPSSTTSDAKPSPSTSTPAPTPLQKKKPRWKKAMQRFLPTKQRDSSPPPPTATSMNDSNETILNVDDITLQPPTNNNTNSNDAPTKLKRQCGDYLASNRLVSHQYGDDALGEVDMMTGGALLHRDHIVDALEGLSEFCRSDVGWGHRVYEPGRSRIVSVVVVKCRGGGVWGEME
ncbi:hypothetical protein HDU67_005763, partial [Dinochytrium kinnereticum]